jgi:hypothetical protein
LPRIESLPEPPKALSTSAAMKSPSPASPSSATPPSSVIVTLALRSR